MLVFALHRQTHFGSFLRTGFIKLISFSWRVYLKLAWFHFVHKWAWWAEQYLLLLKNSFDTFVLYTSVLNISLNRALLDGTINKNIPGIIACVPCMLLFASFLLCKTNFLYKLNAFVLMWLLLVCTFRTCLFPCIMHKESRKVMYAYMHYYLRHGDYVFGNVGCCVCLSFSLIFCLSFCWSVCLLATLLKMLWTYCNDILWGVWDGRRNKWLNFGGNHN